MIDPLLITAIISSLSALIVSILTHIRHSKCFCMDIETTSPEEKKSLLVV